MDSTERHHHPLHHHRQPQHQEESHGYLSNAATNDPTTDQGLRALLAQAPELSQHLGVGVPSSNPQQTDYQDTINRNHHDQSTTSLLQSLSSVEIDNNLSRTSTTAGALLEQRGGSLDGMSHGMSVVVSPSDLGQTSDVGQLSFMVKNEIDQDLSGSSSSTQQQLSGAVQQNHLGMPTAHDILQQHIGHQAAAGLHAHHAAAVFHHSHLVNPHLQHLQPHHIMHAHELAAAAAAAAAAGSDPRLHYGGGIGGAGATSTDCLSTQKAVAFLAGPRERIHVLGNPVEHCPRCQQEGLGTTGWRPHRHIGELKIRYICERHFDDLESNHHFDIPLCPICNQVLYLYDFNNMLGVSNARRLHKYVLKCANRHVLPLLDLFCQTKKAGEKCNANFKLQWCYGTMVKRCNSQKNRDHDLWWVRYKNEWKQRRTIIRYKKDFLSHLTDAQRSLLLGLGLEGEPPPDPKSALGPTFDALVSSAGGSPSGPKVKKRTAERALGLGMNESYGDLAHLPKRRYRPSQQQQQQQQQQSDYGGGSAGRISNEYNRRSTDQVGQIDGQANGRRISKDLNDTLSDPSLRHLMATVVIPNRSTDDPTSIMYMQQQSSSSSTGTSTLQTYNNNNGTQQFDITTIYDIPPEMMITGTPTPPLHTINGSSPVAVSCEGIVLQQPVQ